MSNIAFRFKQFTLHQDRCAMKVGTDGVLLGSWAKVRGSVLDIGSGTGVIALMMVQRGASDVVGVEVDSEAAGQAEYNFSISPWSDILKIENISIQDYAKGCDKRFDTIVSNPPYFINSKKPPKLDRVIARHTQLLPYEELAAAVAVLLEDDGHFFAIFPYDESNVFIAVAALAGLYLNERVDIRPVVGKGVKRVMVSMSKRRSVEVVSSELVIAVDGNRTYSQQYRNLTKEFYLDF